MSVLALDIETKNYAHEIGGWENTHMFIPSTVCTWDGEQGTIYIDKNIDDMIKGDVLVKSLSELKFDLDDHLKKGGVLLGHNIAAFDLRVLRDAMDIYCIKGCLEDKAYIDTTHTLNKEYGERYSLNNLVQHTLGAEKLMDGADAPMVWKSGGYAEVAEYCLDDCKLVYDLWKHGQKESFVKGFSMNDSTIKKMEVDW